MKEIKNSLPCPGCGISFTLVPCHCGHVRVYAKASPGASEDLGRLDPNNLDPKVIEAKLESLLKRHPECGPGLAMYLIGLIKTYTNSAENPGSTPQE